MTFASRYVTLQTTQNNEYIDFYFHYIPRFMAGIISLLVLLNRNKIYDFWNFFNFAIRTKYHQNIPVDPVELKFYKLYSFSVFVSHFQPLLPLALH